MQTISTTAGAAEGEGYRTFGTPTIETSVVRSGSAALKISTANSYARWNIVLGVGNIGYFRSYIRFSGTITNGAYPLIEAVALTTVLGKVFVSDDSLTLTLRDTSGQIGSASSTLSNNTWYKVDLIHGDPNDAGTRGILELWIDDVQIASTTSGSVGTAQITNWRLGNDSAGTPDANMYFDDVALNDDASGGLQTNRPPASKIILVSGDTDSSRDNWTAGGGSTSNLVQALDNIPPVGVASGSATDTSQIKNSTAGPGEDYVMNIGSSYDSLVGSTSNILLTQAIGTFGGATTTSQNANLRQETNPTGTEPTALATPTSVIGTYPSNWRTHRDVVQYEPSLVRNFGRTLRIEKESNTTDELHCCFLGQYIEYREGFSASATDSASLSESVSRATTYSRSETDNPSISESVSRQSAYLRDVSDDWSLSESVSRELLYSRAITDDIIFNESLIRSSIVSRSPTDDVFLSESLSRQLAFLRYIIDSFSLSESLGTNRIYSRNLTDDISLSESLSRSLIYGRSETDLISLNESLSSPVSFLRQIIDDVQLSESLSGGKSFSRSTTDDVSLSDSISTSIIYSRNLTEGIILSEIISRAIIYSRLIEDYANLSESLDRQAIYSTSLTDNISLSDSLFSELFIFRNLTEGINLSESISIVASADYVINLTDLINLSDSISRSSTYSRSMIDNITLVETAIHNFQSIFGAITGFITNRAKGNSGSSSYTLGKKHGKISSRPRLK